MKEIERSFASACERGDFRLVHYSLQSNHAHLIVEATGPEALGRGMRSIAARFARAVNRAFRRSGPVLEERYHSRALRTAKEVRNALRYVLLNVSKHRRAALKGVDSGSSGKWFDGWKTAPAHSQTERRSVSPAHTWLLRRGWRRHGLLDWRDVPGP